MFINFRVIMEAPESDLRTFFCELLKCLREYNVDSKSLSHCIVKYHCQLNLRHKSLLN